MTNQEQKCLHCNEDLPMNHVQVGERTRQALEEYRKFKGDL